MKKTVRLVPKILLPIVLIVASLAGAGFLRATKPAVEPSPEVEQIWTVRVETARRGDHRPLLKLYGEIVAGREVILRPLVAGEVIDASPRLVEGGRFERDETLLRIDPFDYQAAIDELNAQLREARARRVELVANRSMDRMMLELDREQLALTERDLTRYQRLTGSRAASEKALDDAKIALSRKRAEVGQREQSIVMIDARIEQQDAAIARLEVALRRAERDLADTEVTAPFGGFVTDVSAQLGKRLGSGDPIARLIDDQRLEIGFQLNDADFGRLWRDGLIGREVRAVWRLGAASFEIEAKVARVVSTIDAAAGGVTVYAEITANPADAPLRPGAFVEISLPDRTYRDVVELPASALFAGDTVYVVEEGRLVARTVDLMAGRGNSILIRGDVAEGEPIVVSRLAEIAPGIKVQTVSGAEVVR